MRAGSQEARFFAKVQFQERPYGCWEWTAGTDQDGYAQFKARYGVGRYKTVRAARFSYEMFKGTIPAGLNILHSCDNRRCVRPDHLEAGTQSKNIKDCFARGRGHRKAGTINHHAKLTEEAVTAARAEFDGKWGSVTRLARKYGVNPSTMHEAIHGKAWRHV